MSVHLVVAIVQVGAFVVEASRVVLLPQVSLTCARRQPLLVVDLYVAVVTPNDVDDRDEDDGDGDEPDEHGETEVRTDEVLTPRAILQERV